MPTDYYKVLEVSREASDEEIKKQYRKLARKYHPDVSKLKNAEMRFKEVNEAYEVLKNKEKRRNYDMFGDPDGNKWQAGGFRPGAGTSGQYRSQAGENDFAGFGQGSFSDIFERMFNNNASGPTGQANKNRHTKSAQSRSSTNVQTLDISVKLEDVFLGSEKTFVLTLPGEKDPKRIKVKIPKGIEDGKKIRLNKQGKNGSDILLKINYEKHALFSIEANDVFLNLPITVWEAALGASISVPTLGGNVDLKLPANSQSGKKMRLKGRGLGSNPIGDQYVTLMIKVDPNMTKEMEKAYLQLKNLSSYRPREHFN